MKKNKNQFRQGDVFIEKVNGTLPQGQDATENKRVILAHGEVTGHAHEVIGDEKAVLIRPEDAKAASDLILELQAAVNLVHHGLDGSKGDHEPIALDAGRYEVTRQQEYHPAAIRRVAD